ADPPAWLRGVSASLAAILVGKCAGRCGYVEKAAQRVPAVPALDVDDQQIVGTMGEVVEHRRFMSPVAFEESELVADGVTDPVDPLPEIRGRAAEVIQRALQPPVGIATRQDEAAAGKPPVGFSKQREPGIVGIGAESLGDAPDGIQLAGAKPTHQLGVAEDLAQRPGPMDSAV